MSLHIVFSFFWILIIKHVTIYTGKPGPPRDLKLVSLKRDTVEIKWTRPKDTTFGGKIIGYIPEIMVR